MNQHLPENPILEKISKLKSKLYGGDQTDLSTVDEWTREVKTALITDNLQKHEGIKMIIDKVKENVADIDDVLKTAKSTDLSATERDSMIDVKKFYEWFLDFFVTAQSKIEEVDKRVDNELAG